jgi:hypothetical protein
MAKYKTIYIKRYNDGERNFKRERTVFDFFEIEELLGVTRTNELLKELCDRAQIAFEMGVNLTEVQVDLDKIDEDIEQLNKEVIEKMGEVSGDDDAYDYFPDLLAAFEQVCVQLNKKEVYLKTYEIYEKSEAYADQ